MKLVLKKGCVVNGKPQKAGSTVDVELKEDFNLLIGMGNAVDAKDEAAVKEIKAELAEKNKAAA